MEQTKVKICPYCKCEITADSDIVQCSACEMPHHKECWIENKGCTTFGCDGTIQSATTSKEDFEIEIIEEKEPAISTAKFCGNCGEKALEGAKFCMKCGASLEIAPTPTPAVQSYQPQAQFETTLNQQNTEQKDIAENKWISMLSYFGLLVLIPLLTRKNSHFAKFHANQGILCTLLYVAIRILIYIISSLGGMLLSNTLHGINFIVFLVLAIIGIYNCYKGQLKELPIIGKYRIIK